MVQFSVPNINYNTFVNVGILVSEFSSTAYFHVRRLANEFSMSMRLYFFKKGDQIC